MASTKPAITSSWSKSNAFNQCQRKWQLANIDMLHPLAEYDATLGKLRGTFFHAGMRRLLETLHDGGTFEDGFIAGQHAMDEEYTRQEGESDSLTWPTTLTEALIAARRVYHFHVPKLGLGTRYFPTSLNGKALIEYEFTVPLKKGLAFTGTLDAVLWDSENDEFVLVDWKVRKVFPKDLVSLVDGQIHAYAAAINWMLRRPKTTIRIVKGTELSWRKNPQITLARMWEFRSKLPAEPDVSAKNSKALNTGRASYDTEWNYWATACVNLGIDPEQYRDVMEPKMKPYSAFCREMDALVTPESDWGAWSDLTARMLALQEATTKASKGVQLPASLNVFGCEYCPFKVLCAGPLRYGNDPRPTLEQYFKRNDKPFEFSDEFVVEDEG